MVHAHELRIGNKVYGGLDDVLTVTGIRETGVDTNEGSSNIVGINPIPLTPELLEKCGFVKIKNDILPYWQWKDADNNNSIEWHDDGSVLVGKGGECSRAFNMMDSNKVTTIHRLQNLYFALTGSEIEVNL